MSAEIGLVAKTARVLIVDDNRQNRMLLEVALQADGYQLESASSGAEALQAVARQTPDVILLDVRMPGIDGYEVARRLKSQPDTRHIPIIMVTALHDQEARLQGLECGADDFLSKPVDRAELRVRVKNLVRLKAFQEETLRFKDDFLSHVSHELRSPLTAIKQFSSILLAGLAGELNPEQREYQEIVLRNIHQLQAMIDDLLEVTRLETGKLTIEPEAVSCAEAVADSFDTLRATAALRGIALTSDIPASLPSLCADPTRVRQMLIILLDNAIKFSHSGGTVHTTLRACPGDDDQLEVSVSDAGVGMTPEKVARIFDRLYQSAEHVQHSRKGLGLGLFICRELVVRQGGRIWVTSEEERGSTFFFTLPVFSLASALEPLLTADGWPRDTVGLVTVDLDAGDQSALSPRTARWLQDVRAVVLRCLMPNLDVLLSSTRTDRGERVLILSFADERGVSILARRIQGELERLTHQTQREVRLTVTVTMLPPPAAPNSGTSDNMLAAMSAVLEATLNNHSTMRKSTHE